MLNEKILLSVEKPARYVGGEYGQVLKSKDVDLRIAFCFPDTYEIGMSHLGMKILYSLLNSRDDIWCERAFAPAADMEAVMRGEGMPLFSLESSTPLPEFDIIAFTLQYEMSYTTVLSMLDLAGIPIKSDERGELAPLVIAGGPCACNPEPMASFIDLFVLGEGEEVIMTLCDAYSTAKANGQTKAEFLRSAAHIEGVYVPSLYDVVYNDDGTIKEINPADGAPPTIKKAVVKNLGDVYYPDNFIVPFIDIVHNRAVLEIMRGCFRGCRFCQAGFIYRPVRHKPAAGLISLAKDICKNTGYEEISLCSLSASDYKELPELLSGLFEFANENKINLSLPSLRIDNFSDELTRVVNGVRKSGLTFAPEAGSQRMRDVINKNITEEDIMESCKTAFLSGISSVKLYFMMSLPTETEDDIADIVKLAERIVDLYYRTPNKPRGKGVSITASVAVFVPKPFTPFQWAGQDMPDVILQKQKLLRQSKSRKITINCHDAELSRIEAVLARGDRRLGAAIEAAFKMGARLEGWSEHFSYKRWTEALSSTGLTAEFYANRERSFEEILPWSHLDYSVPRELLIKGATDAFESKTL